MPDRHIGDGIHRHPSDVFDCAAFRADVVDYIDRQGISRMELARLAGVWHSYVYELLNGTYRCPSLLLAVSLADVCDLSLDRYRLSAIRSRDNKRRF